jgi:hypothetical protein
VSTVVPFPGSEAADDTPADDGYDGPAELIDGENTVAVTVTLRGHFDPISGRYSWYGRVAASPEVTALLDGGARKVRLRTPHAEVETALSDVDPWGRPRVEGFGATPFAVLDTLPDTDADAR